MKDKEKLLSFDTDLAFIFSHSTLKEGWDNPNVFQVCTLQTAKSEIRKRQQIGRGLRLCVDSQGNRVIDENINQLNIIANESFEEFSQKLQQEFYDEGLIDNNFKVSHLINEGIKEDEAYIIYEQLTKTGYVNNEKINRKIVMDENSLSDLKNTLLKNNVSESNIEKLEFILSKNSSQIIKNGKYKKINKLKEDVVLSDEFKALWSHISQKTLFKVSLNSQELIDACHQQILADLSKLNGAIYLTTHTKLGIEDNKLINMNKEIVKSENISASICGEVELSQRIYRIVKNLAKEHHLRRITIAKILDDSKIRDKIAESETEAQNLVSKVIQRQKQKILLNGIEYVPINEYYEQKNLENDIEFFYNELMIYQITPEYTTKYPYEYIQCDSRIEKCFATDAIPSRIIKKAIKLPSWFTINTPIGKYNPDWALIDDKNDTYIVETKGSEDDNQLRKSEAAKITYGMKHFESIGTRFIKCSNFKSFLAKKN